MLRLSFSPLNLIILIICLMEVSVPPIVCLHTPLANVKLKSKRDIYFYQHQLSPQDSLIKVSPLNVKSKSSLHLVKSLHKLSPHCRTKKSHSARHVNLNSLSSISKSRKPARKRGMCQIILFLISMKLYQRPKCLLGTLT